MNQKKIRKLLHHMNEQTAKQIADKYLATDQATKEKIYQQISEKRHAMNLNQEQNPQKKMISETYHTPDTKFIPWARTFGITMACIAIMSGTIGGIWRLTRLSPPAEDVEELKLIAESNTDTSTTNQTETTSDSETQTTIQTVPVIMTSGSVTSSTTSVTSETSETVITSVTSTTTLTAPTTAVTTTRIPAIPEPTAVITDTVTIPIVPEPPATESFPTAPITTETSVITIPPTEPVATKPSYRSAYLEICEEYEKDFDNLSYCLYDVDKDGTPELIIHGFSYWISLYTYADNQVYELMDKWSFGINNNMGYCFHPEKNSIYYNVGEYAGLIYHNIYLTITPEHTLIEENVLTQVNDVDTLFEQYSYLKNDDSHSYINGNGYYLNYEKITEEEFNTFYTENYPTNYNLDLDYKSYSEFLESFPE
ncbi:MAG: hypothetical protein K2G25_10130 [Oscillospiraceae bacterium]|nr:hypothetical protein [Oscillospiraceae bacterium]